MDKAFPHTAISIRDLVLGVGESVLGKLIRNPVPRGDELRVLPGSRR